MTSDTPASVIWRCPRKNMLRLYDRNVGERHLDLGPGTGFFLDRCGYSTSAPRDSTRSE